MRIVHTADLHLDASFASLHLRGEVAAALRQARRESLRRLVEVALAEGADVVTIAGDLYEHERSGSDTANFLRAQFERLAPRPVLLPPGNHDPYSPDSLYRQTSWPGNVFVFRDERLQPLPLAEGVTVWGAGHGSPSLRRSLLAPVEGVGTHLLLLHASDTTSVPPGKEPHCPLTSQQVADCGFAAALLGHYHRPSSLSPGQTLLYPGSPEPLGFDEEGDHGALLLDLDGGALSARSVCPARLRFASLVLDVSGADNRDTVGDALAAQAREGGLEGAFLRLRLVGSRHPDLDLDPEALASRFADIFASLDLSDKTRPPYDYQALAREVSTRGLFVRKVLARADQQGEEQFALVDEALELGLRAFAGEELRPR